MSKFKVGDKVTSVKTGATGVVQEAYGGEKYAVMFDGAKYPDRVEGFQIKAANGCAKNAKFKVGDRVRDTEAMRDGVIVEVDAEKPGYYAVKYDTRPQPQWNVPESYLTLANAAPASANPVVQNAINARTARNADDNYYLSAKKSIEDAGRLLASAVISLSRSNAPNSASIHEELVKMSDAFERIRKRL